MDFKHIVCNSYFKIVQETKVRINNATMKNSNCYSMSKYKSRFQILKAL